MKPVTPSSVGLLSSCELIDDNDCPELNHIVHITLPKVMGVQRLRDVMHQIHVCVIVEIFHAEETLSFFHALFRE